LSKVRADGSGLEYTYMLAGRINTLWVDDRGAVYFAGATRLPLPVTPNAFQRMPKGDLEGFVGKLDPSGRGLEFLTYLGASYQDSIATLALDAAGNVYVGGGSRSDDLPVTPDALQRNRKGPACDTSLNFEDCQDAFLAKLSPDGSRLLYLSYLGGNKNDELR